MSDTAKISLYSHPRYVTCLSHATAWEEEHAAHYRSLICLKSVRSRRRQDTVVDAHGKIAHYITESCEDVMGRQQDFLCTLPVGHDGQCTHQPHTKMVTHSAIANKLDWIYTTPGDDDYIYKNRCYRLFPVVVSDETEKVWRNKTVKLKCAIPLREASSPLLMAAAYLDYMALILHVEGIGEYLSADYAHTAALRSLAATHMPNLVAYYGRYGRRILDADGFAICPVTRERITALQLGNNDIKDDNSIQLGHVVPRSESEFTIRGKNVLLMSRKGNRIVGDNIFTENGWIDELRSIISAHSL